MATIIGGNPSVEGTIPLNTTDVENIVWQDNGTSEDVFELVLDGQTIWKKIIED